MTDPLCCIQDPASLSGLKSTPEAQEELVLYIPEMEEIRISLIVARKGFLNILEQKSNGWKKRWVVSEILRAFVFQGEFTPNVGNKVELAAC